MRELLSRRCLLNWDLKMDQFTVHASETSHHNKLPRHCGICQALVFRYQKWNLDTGRDTHFVLVCLMTAVRLFCCHDLTVIFLLEVRATLQWSPGMRCSTKFGIYWHCSAASVILGLCLLVLWWRILCLITFVLCLIWIEKIRFFTASLIWSRNFHLEWQSTENAFPIK